MKKFILTIGILFSLFFNSCTNNTPVAPQDSQQGGISLNIDRVHKPDNVVSVTAYLTRENFDTLSGSLNLLSDTTADITFNDVAAGGWHLKVDAADEQNTVVYTGESDVNILADVTTPVYLTLEPTGNGYGNIYIFVNWGVPQNTGWIDYQYNPIISQPIIPDYPNAITQPKILYENGIYKMWMTSLYNSAVSNIWYAVSTDGINWQLGHNGPVFTPSNTYTWDSHTVCGSVVLKDENEYKMYYTGFADEYGAWHVGLATSVDGINWVRLPNPVVYADPVEQKIIVGDVIKINGTYYLYYSVRQYPYYDIRVATSQDGVNFTKPGNNPLLIPVENWEGTGIFSPSVIFENGQFKMVYVSVSQAGTDLGMAYSADGINWTKDPGNPFFDIDEVHNDWCARITYPFIRKINGQYRIYYTGNLDVNWSAMIGVIIK